METGGGARVKLGYIRVSRDKQTTALQEDAMHNEQVERVFTDKMSGKNVDRPEFQRMLDVARAGDVIVVWRLDRLGRSLKQLIETVMDLNERGIELRSLKENIDTSTSTGKLMFHIIGAMAEFERDVIRERTFAGLEAARARGRKGGRSYLLTGEKLTATIKAWESRKYTTKELCAMFGIARSTLFRYMREHKAEQEARAAREAVEQEERAN
jgi:DNA invertase Pin-like site-specific DNA recombinase